MSTDKIIKFQGAELSAFLVNLKFNFIFEAVIKKRVKTKLGKAKINTYSSILKRLKNIKPRSIDSGIISPTINLKLSIPEMKRKFPNKREIKNIKKINIENALKVTKLKD